MLVVAVQLSTWTDYDLRGVMSIDELKETLKNCVKERFIALNCESVDMLIGRTDDMVKVKGVNMFPAQIEDRRDSGCKRRIRRRASS